MESLRKPFHYVFQAHFEASNFVGQPFPIAIEDCFPHACNVRIEFNE